MREEYFKRITLLKETIIIYKITKSTYSAHALLNEREKKRKRDKTIQYNTICEVMTVTTKKCVGEC